MAAAPETKPKAAWATTESVVTPPHSPSQVTVASNSPVPGKDVESQKLLAKSQSGNVTKVAPDCAACGDDGPLALAKRGTAARCLALALMCVAGFWFGFVLQKSRVFEPHLIRDIFLYSRWLMLKVFLAAACSGTFFLAIASVLPATRGLFLCARGCINSTCNRGCKRGLVAAAGGGIILGGGMALAGACPGIVMIQVGSGVPNSLLTLGGCLLGALLFSLAADTPAVNAGIRAGPVAPLFRREGTLEFVDHLLGVDYWKLALPLAAVIAAAVAVLEVLVDWRDEAGPLVGGAAAGSVFEKESWPPWVSGCCVGILQIVTLLVMGDTLGTSTAYETVTSQWVAASSGLQERFPYMAKRVDPGRWLENWFQVSYAVGVVFGAWVASAATDLATPRPVAGVPAYASLAGGVMMVWGSRLGGGCTSGHGLSGMALLSILSFVAVPCMFIGGTVTALALRAAGEHTPGVF